MNEKFGQFVRNKREEKKINLRKLAEILDIAPAYMSDMEKARRYPPDKEKLVKKYGREKIVAMVADMTAPKHRFIKNLENEDAIGER